jgi:hypothetical protein
MKQVERWVDIIITVVEMYLNVKTKNYYKTRNNHTTEAGIHFSPVHAENYNTTFNRSSTKRVFCLKIHCAVTACTIIHKVNVIQ